MEKNVKKSLESLGVAFSHSDGNEYVGLFLGKAQVEATLALVEQQRIANLIALTHADQTSPFAHQLFEFLPDDGVAVREDVQAVLSGGA